jgi:hypothetical protein
MMLAAANHQILEKEKTRNPPEMPQKKNPSQVWFQLLFMFHCSNF